MKTADSNQHRFTLTGDNETFTSELEVCELQEDLHVIKIRISADSPDIPPVFSLCWTHAANDIQNFWHPAIDRNRALKADWMRKLRSNAAASAPVASLFNQNGSNRITFAFSDALNTVRYWAGIREESAEFECAVELFTEATAPLQAFEGSLYVDTREIPYYESLRDVQRWWEAIPEYSPAWTPDVARSPMYSTWYSMHQNVTAQAIEQQCAMAKELGMDAVIVDDGWQTGDNRRGYAYCGDWEPFAGKFTEMNSHVERVHALGLKFILWYSVPFVGKHSKAWERFKDQMLRVIDNLGAGVLDPRYPEVREYLIATYARAVQEWGVDGFKLDFIDSFYAPDYEVPKPDDRMDYVSVPAAVDRLLTDSIAHLRMLKPDMMVEFRQNYIGPAMRKYGNMFRAADCPNDALQNRLRTLDLRLLCGDTAAHADMIMWHPGEPAESAALQFINILFAVPQVSVLLEKLPYEHQRMLRYWLSFWTEHRDVLLHGELKPSRPELNYPLVEAKGVDKTVVVTYHDELIPFVLGNDPTSQWILVNGRLKEGVYLNVPERHAGKKVLIELRSATGDPAGTEQWELAGGVRHLGIPASGTASFRVL
ncbi:glycoside hydrolase family 36 protein [Paenibacillus puerhi]|uniref:glycoside hydrolase family 36 protein n=1 Tax=Paenibacillus puerhi TaxID=2692622 RepID=UPI001358F67E|nr:glycoside hydrolase family 36 protein [Paenibacillus puerhi]